MLREFLIRRRGEVTKVTQLDYIFVRSIELAREDTRKEERVNTKRERIAKEQARQAKEKAEKEVERRKLKSPGSFFQSSNTATASISASSFELRTTTLVSAAFTTTFFSS